MHILVENTLDEVCKDVAKSYREYRNYKQDFIHIMDEVLKMNQSIMYLADKSNANTDSALTSTKRCLLYKKLSKELYQKVFLKQDESQAIKDGFIYIHDITDRLHCSHNCCVVDFSKILENGFELANIKYGRPQRITSAMGSICDIALTTSAQQYGGFTISHLDKVMSPYIEMTYNAYYNEFKEAFEFAGVPVDTFTCEKMALKKVKKDVLNAVQSMELKFNTLSSSRGDFSFITVTFGLETDRWGKMFSEALLEVRQKGQGNPPVPVLFPKLVFLTDPKNLHGEGKPNRDLFLKACECSNVCMYPDYISLLYTEENDNYLGKVYERYGKAISPMRMQSFLKPVMH